MPIEIRAAASIHKLREPASSGSVRAPVRWPGTAPGRLRSSERSRIAERIALLLEAGIPIHTALVSLERQTREPRVRAALAALAEGVAGGQSLSAALDRQGDFDASYVHLVAAGERGGFLPTVLERLRDMEEKRRELAASLVSALAYPGFLLCFSLAVIGFVLAVVFPKFSALFTEIHDELPLTTRWLMAASDLLVAHGALLGVGALLAVAAGALWLRRPGRWEAMERLALRLPLVRELLIELALVRMMYVLALSLDHGVALVDALRSCAASTGSRAFRSLIASLMARVSGGEPLAAGFRDSALVPPLVRELIATGEESSRLALVARRIAEHYEREWRRKLAVAARIAEPLLLLVMGAVVGLLVASLVLPIFKLSRAVH